MFASIFEKRRADQEIGLCGSMDSCLRFTPLVYYYGHGRKMTRPTALLLLVLLLCTISLCLVFAACFFFCSSHLLCFYQANEDLHVIQSERTVEKPKGSPPPPSPCSSMPNNTICCDRTAYRSDVCFMRGDVRTHSAANSILLYRSSTNHSTDETIRPYTRKWETSIMSTITELRLRANSDDAALQYCEVRHDATAVVFSTGGYTGNVYHDFNDGLIPLYITLRQLNKKVVFVVLEYKDWWIAKYSAALSRLSDHPPIDYSNDRRTHCFPEAVVGLRIHDELTVDPTKMEKGESIRDFRSLLDAAFRPRIQKLELEEEEEAKSPGKPKQNTSADDANRPKLVILSRNGSRAIENEAELVQVAEGIGYLVEVLKPDGNSELAKIYRALNGSDAVVGVHGAALTHLLFMRPGSVLVQIVPLGTAWAAKVCYGEPAAKLGLWYLAYEILPRESSLHREYQESDPVLENPMSVANKSWQVTKNVYLDKQNVTLDLDRFHLHLFLAHRYLERKKKSTR